MAKRKRFDPFGRGYDTDTAKKSGMKRKQGGKNKGHMGSLDPSTGMVLKGMRHESATQMRAVEELRGSKMKFDSGKGRYHSVGGNPLHYQTHKKAK